MNPSLLDTLNNDATADRLIDLANRAYYAKDYRKAVATYAAMSKLGNPRALNNYGKCLLNGYGCAEDHDEAIRYLCEAGMRAFPPALESIYKLVDIEDSESIPYPQVWRHAWAASKVEMQMKRLDKTIDKPFAMLSNLSFDVGQDELGPCHTCATCDLTVNGMKNRHITIDYYLYPRDTERSIVARLSHHPNVAGRKRNFFLSQWELIVPYDAVRWTSMPAVLNNREATNGLLGNDTDYIFLVTVWDDETKALLAQSEIPFHLER